jgi:predicted ribosome quality control (RQC) complex YloA/Tae2 family protein
MLRFERVVEIALRRSDETLRLYLEATGRRGNLVAVDEGGAVRAALRWEKPERSPLRPLVPGAPYRPPPEPPGLVSPDEVTPANLAVWMAFGEPLHHRVRGLGPVLAREIADRVASGDDPWRAFCAVAESYGAAGPIREYAVGLSAVPLIGQGAPVAVHESGLARAGAWLEAELARAEEGDSARDASRQAVRFRSRLERRLAGIRADLASLLRVEDLETEAVALAAHLWAVEPGTSEADVPDLGDPRRVHRVPLDP